MVRSHFIGFWFVQECRGQWIPRRSWTILGICVDSERHYRNWCSDDIACLQQWGGFLQEEHGVSLQCWKIDKERKETGRFCWWERWVIGNTLCLLLLSIIAWRLFLRSYVNSNNGAIELNAYLALLSRREYMYVLHVRPHIQGRI